MTAIASLGWLTIDCDDAGAQAEFYASALGWEITFSEGPVLRDQRRHDHDRVQRRRGLPAPELAGRGRAKQFHLELMVDDLDAAAAELIAAGAAQPEFQPGGERFRVLTDPAGHPFCIIKRDEAANG